MWFSICSPQESRTTGQGSRQRLTRYRATEEPEYLETDDWDSDSLDHLPARTTHVLRTSDGRTVVGQTSSHFQQMNIKGPVSCDTRH